MSSYAIHRHHRHHRHLFEDEGAICYGRIRIVCSGLLKCGDTVMLIWLFGRGIAPCRPASILQPASEWAELITSRGVRISCRQSWDGARGMERDLRVEPVIQGIGWHRPGL